MATTILDAVAHTVDTNVASFAVSAGSNRIAFIALIGYYYTAGAAAPTSCTLGGQAMELVTTQDQSTRLSVALFKLEEAGIAAMSGNAVVFSGETFSARSSVYWSVQGAHQTTNPAVAAISQASGNVSVSLARTADSLTVALVGNEASGSAFTCAEPVESAEFNVLSSIGIAYGAATDTARTANYTATVPDSVLMSVGFAVNIPASSPAPTISAGTPTGTVGGSVTAGFTSTASSGTARIVVDTAANLDAVTNTQVAAGQKENGTAAAYDSGNITVTDTTPEYTFNLPTGTWQIAAVHDGSTVLSWSITVDSSPTAFSFTDQAGVAVSSVRTSNTITVAGLGGATAVSVSGGEYRKNGGSWGTAAGTVVNTDTIEVRHTSSALYNTVTNTVLTIGDSSDTFSSTTLAITLSSPTAASGTTSTASGTVSTNVGSGTIYTVASASATAPSAAQLEAGQMHTGAAAAGAASPLTVTATGNQNLSLSSLPQGTPLYLHSVQKVGSQYSNIATSAVFTTRGIGAVDGDNIVNEGQTSVAITGKFGSSTPVVRIKSGSFTSDQTVTANSTSSITISPIARGSLPYTDANHTHLIEVDTDQ